MGWQGQPATGPRCPAGSWSHEHRHPSPARRAAARARARRPGAARCATWTGPADAFASLGPNWFASVMGTGIVATAAAVAPAAHWPGLRVFGTVIWLLAAALAGRADRGRGHPLDPVPAGRPGHARNPVMVQFYGAPPMAMLTVGAGALLLGPALIGAHAALVIDAVLWPLGTLTGLASSLAGCRT